MIGPVATPALDDEKWLANAPRLDRPLALRVLSLWVWPAAAIVVIAVVGQLVGPFGAAVSGALILVSAVAVVGVLAGRRSLKVNWVVLALTVGVAAAVVLVAAAGLHSTTDADQNLRGREVTDAMVRELNLRGMDLSGARLDGRDLRNESLAGVVAKGASFRRARLDGVTLRGADLSGADLTDACLAGADLAGAVLSGVRIAGADLSPNAINASAVGASGKPATATPSWCH